MLDDSKPTSTDNNLLFQLVLPLLSRHLNYEFYLFEERLPKKKKEEINLVGYDVLRMENQR